jgi:uncharacterized protein YqjF (DUF2071 family)
MKTILPEVEPELPPALRAAPKPTGEICHRAMGRLLSLPHEPLFFADWDRTLMLHYEVAPEVLRPHVPFPLDLHGGKAYVSLVAFTLRDMRPRWGGKLGRLAFRPIASHGFLNVRTYVRVGHETGIYFLTEYMNNLLSLKLGPAVFGLPYRFARLDYRHEWERGTVSGRISDPGAKAAFSYVGHLPPATGFAPSPAGSLTEWLMERYTAFLTRGTKRGFFRVWHPPWANVAADIHVLDDTLLRRDLPWFAKARYVGANFSPGTREVWMGRPHPLP